MQDNNWTRQLREIEDSFSPRRPSFIYEPPCKDCAYFLPRIATNRSGDFGSIVLCHKIPDLMRQDFTCYVEKEDTDD